MIDWEEIAGADDVDELKDAKLWLFRENIRLENERRELAASREKFRDERRQMRRELDELNRRMAQEQKRLAEENLFFEKKLAILQDGFRQLDKDRRTLEQQRRSLAEDRTRICQQGQGREHLPENTARRLFAGVSNSLALRKRYRDLIKIFHPDNLFGDEELVQMINREYSRKRDELQDEFFQR
ncbi:MAG: hypothetical protein OSJ69_08360 [Acetatifactor sp.]|nr:hypothetical protein [Acetatifactor sp.]